MKKTIRYIVAIFIGIISLSFVSKDSVESVLKGFEKAYEKKVVSMIYKIEYKTLEDEKILYEKAKIVYGKSFYSIEKEDLLFFVDKKYEISIDNKNKSITVKKTVNGTFKKNEFSSDTIIKSLKTIHNLSLSTTDKEYLVKSELYTYDCTYYFDKISYKLNKVDYIFKNDKEYKSMTVKYENISFNNSVKNTAKSYRDIISFSFGKLKAKGKYKRYKLINKN